MVELINLKETGALISKKLFSRRTKLEERTTLRENTPEKVGANSVAVFAPINRYLGYCPFDLKCVVCRSRAICPPSDGLYLPLSSRGTTSKQMKKNLKIRQARKITQGTLSVSHGKTFVINGKGDNLFWDENNWRKHVSWINF